MNNNYYKESQSFITKWLIVLFAVLFALELYQLYIDYQSVNSIQISISFWILMVVALCLIFIRLQVNINKNGIRISFIPFVINKIWKWEDMEQVYITDYSLTDYGGWGFRISSKGRAYTTRGKYGIQIILKDGRKILIGTQEPEKVSAILNHYFTPKDEK